MFGFSAFRRKPRQFSYKPLYYDPEKEERDLKRKMREARGENITASENKDEKYVPGSYIRGMRRERMMGTSIKTKKDSRESRNRIIIRLVIFLILLFIVFKLIMNDTIIEKMFSTFLAN